MPAPFDPPGSFRLTGPGRHPAVLTVLPTEQCRALVLLLHGGSVHSRRPTSARGPAVLRMVPIATALRRGGAADGLTVALLRFGVAGWNDEAASPVPDAEWALAELARRYGRVPVAVVGHSMGGRAAVRVAGVPTVRSVVGLAPWLPAGEPVARTAGRRVALLHGTRDRTTSPRETEAYAARARAAGADVTVVLVRRAGHAMLRRARLWHRLTEDMVRAGLGLPGAGLDLPGAGRTGSGPATNVGQTTEGWQARLVV